ncbi:MAG: hypothetical protein AABY93_09445 [Bacteroidota bacterium]
MLLILLKELESDWLRPITDMADKELIESVIQPYDESKLLNYTAERLRGKEANGNKPEALQPVRYTELEETQGSLF